MESIDAKNSRSRDHNHKLPIHKCAIITVRVQYYSYTLNNHCTLGDGRLLYDLARLWAPSLTQWFLNLQYESYRWLQSRREN